jgi:hypothetical protein
MVSKIAAIFLALSLTACQIGGVGNSDADGKFSDGIRTMGQLSSEAQQWARRVKTDARKGTLNSEQYEMAYSLYIKGKAATDAYIDQLCFDLAAKKRHY